MPCEHRALQWSVTAGYYHHRNLIKNIKKDADAEMRKEIVIMAVHDSHLQTTRRHLRDRLRRGRPLEMIGCPGADGLL